jgi:myo-inositol-1(or 4)-monophosphatase
MADKRCRADAGRGAQKARPDWGFLLEEGGEIEGDPNKPRWIIDPLDGTTNFLARHPALRDVDRGGGAARPMGKREITTG